jgi:signal transduction histidine kinase
MMFHVFPSGRLCSLRRALLVWLLPVFLLVGAASAGFAYWSYQRMASAFMDNQMELLAESMGAQEQVVALPALTRERVHKLGSYVVQAFDAQGHQRFSSWPDLRLALRETPGFQDVREGGERWRVYTKRLGPAQGSRSVQVLQSGEFRRHLAVSQAGTAIAPVIILLPLSFLILWGVVAMVSRAVGDIARQAAAQDEHNIAELPLDRVPREIAPLVVSFNSLLTRLRSAFATQRRFVQDAAHELRTPLAAIGLQLENLRGDLCTGAPAQRFAQLEAGVQRAQRLVDQLLKLSRQECTVAEAAPLPVNVREVLHESINQLITLADQRNIDLGLDASRLEDAMLPCPMSDLRSVVDNLIENALRYAPQGSVVDVRAESAKGRLVIEVEDSGPGIAPDLLGRVFDRFYRVPGSEVQGNGLGLSIAQAAAQRCGLRISLRNREGGSGLVARVETA